jgi:hypothetical protein
MILYIYCICSIRLGHSWGSGLGGVSIIHLLPSFPSISSSKSYKLSDSDLVPPTPHHTKRSSFSLAYRLGPK